MRYSLLLILLIGWCVPAQSQVVYTTRAENYIREGAGSFFNLVTTVPKNTQLRLLQKSRGWAKVSLPDKRVGWTSEQSITATPPSKAYRDKLSTETASTKVSKVGMSAAVKAFAKGMGNTADPEEMDYVVDAFESGPGSEAYTSFKQPLQQRSSNRGKFSLRELRLGTARYNQSLDEIKIGASVSSRILATFDVVKNRDLEEYLTLIAATLTENTDFYDWKISIFVLDSPMVNGFAAPGGYIFVTRGLIESCEDESELAAVLAHEIGHLIRRHGLQETTRRQADIKAEGAFDELDEEVGGKSAEEEDLDNMALESYNRVVHKRLFSYELEADKVAAVLSANAGYDPYGIVRISKTIQRIQASQPKPDIFDSEYFEQDDAKERTTKIESFVKKYYSQRNAGQRLQSRFLSRAHF